VTTETARNSHQMMIGLCNAGRFPEALEIGKKTLLAHPNYTPIVRTYQSIGRNTGDIAIMHKAAEYFQRAGIDSVDPLNAALFADQLYCDWTLRNVLLDDLAMRFEYGQACRENNLSMLAAVDSPELHWSVANCFTRDVLAKVRPVSGKAVCRVNDEITSSRRIKIGYVSCDFFRHPMARVLADLIENHNRAKFHVYAYDYSPDDGSDERTRLLNAFDTVRSIKSLDFLSCARMMASDYIDILIDLKGYTQKACPEVFALRPAPIQVSFLGYPGTLAAPWIDYALADRHVLPPSERVNWSESIAYMPRTYYPSVVNKPQVVTPDQISRESLGLPASGFVFGCFNNPFKITPEVFAVWMRILREAPNSIIWFYNRMSKSRENLKFHASKNEVDPTRLIFADFTDHVSHIKRYACMDLFLDTAPYNAHTTATDALSAGVPLLTLPGRSFASRVALSLLRTLGLEELIASDIEDYVEKAIGFSQEPQRFAAVKASLERACSSSSLFDSVRYTHDVESLFLRMVELRRAGDQPRDINDFL
jgi:protein O-GlcNAc transferase